MKHLYITADKVGTPTGGGVVTYNEVQALKEMGTVLVLSADNVELPDDPFGKDLALRDAIQNAMNEGQLGAGGIVHFYSGSNSECVRFLNNCDTPPAFITHTVAAHSKEESQKAHEELGIPFNYPHLTDPDIWDRYVWGIRHCDHLIVPSICSREACDDYKLRPRGGITVIPHGTLIPSTYRKDPPGRFTVGYMGAVGPDKGVFFLLKAWKEWEGSKDSTLVLAGVHSRQLIPIVDLMGLNNVHIAGWVRDVSDFYNQLSVYVQPSITEGFGIEVVEAYAHGVPVLCSSGAGARDCVSLERCFKARDTQALAGLLERERGTSLEDQGIIRTGYRLWSERFSWENIRKQYVRLWTEKLKAWNEGR
jgi:glycosyltransferase involved in cell wall biosynthesis